MSGTVEAIDVLVAVGPRVGDATPVGAVDGPMVEGGDAADAQAAARVEHTTSDNAYRRLITVPPPGTGDGEAEIEVPQARCRSRGSGLQFSVAICEVTKPRAHGRHLDL